MSDTRRTDEEGDEMSLLRLAGPRPAPSPAAAAAARAQVRDAWRAGVRRRRTRTALVAAAAVGVAISAATLSQRDLHPAPQGAAPVGAAVLGSVDAGGPVEREAAAGWTPLAVGDAVLEGSRIRTAGSGAGLRAPDGRSLRVAADSRVLWETQGRLTLEAGAVYLDSGRPAADAARPFEVRTAWGVVRETGTQFEVRLDPAGLRVRVREGLVAVRDETAAGGVELRVDSGGVTRRAFPVHGSEWAWVLSLAPAFEMDGRSLHELASWASREAGWELVYLDAESRRRAESAVLRGSIRGVRPDEAVIAVTPSTGLRPEVKRGLLEIGPDGARPPAR
jgi:hypothetical protein